MRQKGNPAEIKVILNKERPKAPTKVRSFIIIQLLSEICSRFRGSCNTFDEVN